MTFELPSSAENQLQNWTQFQDTQYMDPYAFLQTATTPGLFEIQSLDQSALSSDPTGEVEIAVGNIHTSDDVSNFLGSSFFDSNAVPGQMLNGVTADYPGSDGYNINQFLNFTFDMDASYHPMTPLDGPSTNNFGDSLEQIPTTESIPEPSETVAGPSSLYVPPAGAAHSSSRRVGGNWASFMAQANSRSSSQQELTL